MGVSYRRSIFEPKKQKNKKQFKSTDYLKIACPIELHYSHIYLSTLLAPQIKKKS